MNSYLKRQVLTFYLLGKTNLGKPYGRGGGEERGHCPLVHRRANFPGEEFSRTLNDIFKCAPRWKKNRS